MQITLEAALCKVGILQLQVDGLTALVQQLQAKEEKEVDAPESRTSTD